MCEWRRVITADVSERACIADRGRSKVWCCVDGARMKEDQSVVLLQDGQCIQCWDCEGRCRLCEKLWECSVWYGFSRADSNRMLSDQCTIVWKSRSVDMHCTERLETKRKMSNVETLQPQFHRLESLDNSVGLLTQKLCTNCCVDLVWGLSRTKNTQICSVELVQGPHHTRVTHEDSDKMLRLQYPEFYTKDYEHSWVAALQRHSCVRRPIDFNKPTCVNTVIEY